MRVTSLQRNAEIQRYSVVTGTQKASNFFFRYFWDVNKEQGAKHSGM
jgi:hypothetical protein